ncbi:hypothetical protein BH09CHL1_BH09CHL1_20740 [soil metagenome]
MIRPSWIEMLVSSRIRVVAPLAAIAGVAVGRTAVAAQSTPSADDAQALLDRAIAGMAALDSYSFEFESKNGEIALIPEVFTIHDLEGDVVRPDAFQAETEVEVLFVDLDIRVVTIGDDSWITNPLVLVGSGNDMVRIGEVDFDGGFNPAWAVNPDHIALPLLGIIEDPTISATGSTSSLTQIDGEISLDMITELGEMFAGAVVSDFIPDGLPPLQVSVWIGSDDLVHKLEIEGQLFRSESSGLVRSFEFDDFNEPITIDRP